MNAQPSRLTPEDIVDCLVPSSVCVSPDGKRVAWVAAPRGRKSDKTVSSLWIANIGKEHSARQLTSGQWNDRNPQWSPNGELIAFSSDRHILSETNAIYILSLQGGEPYAITKPENKRPIGFFSWSPNGRFIVYLSPDEKSAEQLAKEEAQDDAEIHGTNWEYNRLRLLHIGNRETSVLCNQSRHITHLCWSPDSKKIVFGSQTNTDVEAMDLSGVEFASVSIFDSNVTFITTFPHWLESQLHWLQDDVYFAASVEPHSFGASSTGVFRLSISEKSIRKYQHGDVDDACFLASSRDALFTHTQVNLAEEVCDSLRNKILYSSKEEIVAMDAVRTAEGEDVIAVVQSNFTQTHEVYALSTIHSQSMCQLSNHGDKVPKATGSAFEISCRTLDGTDQLDCFFLSPEKDRPKHPLPTLVLVHGGPHFRQTNSFDAPHMPWAPYILSLGEYGVLLPNYRGSSSKGDAYASLPRGHSGTLEHDDLLAQVDEGVKQGFIDPENVIIGGWSYGGLLSFLSAVRNGKDFTGNRGPSNIKE